MIDIKPLKLEFDSKLVFGTEEFNRIVYVRAIFCISHIFQNDAEARSTIIIVNIILLHVFQTNFDA